MAAQSATVEAGKVHWNAFFTDPRLQALIKAALTHNRDLQIAAAKVAEARAQFGIVRADRVPTVNLSGAASSTRTPADLNGTGSPSMSERYDLSVTTVSFELDFWGRIKGLSEAAKSNYLSTEDAKRTVQLSLISDVATAYFTLIEMDAIAKLARASVQSREETLSLIGKGRDLGGAYDFEYQQASGILESARASLDSVAHQRNVAFNRLSYLVGDMPTDLPAGRSLYEQVVDTEIAPGLPGDVLLLRPDVMAAEEHLLAAHANIGAARAAFWPKVLLTAGIGVASKGLASLFDGDAWNFQPSISLPLFDGGRLAASVDIAEARKVIAVAEYEKTIQLAFREIADLLSARVSLGRQLKAANFNEMAQSKRLEIARARQAAGLISYLDVLEGQRELVAAQQAAVQVRRTQLESAAQLYKALGGGAALIANMGGA